MIDQFKSFIYSNTTPDQILVLACYGFLSCIYQSTKVIKFYFSPKITISESESSETPESSELSESSEETSDENYVPPKTFNIRLRKRKRY
jgi:hypothetical protein